MTKCIQSAILNRIDVLNNLKKFRIHPKHRSSLLKNLNYFKIKSYKRLEGFLYAK